MTFILAAVISIAAFARQTCFVHEQLLLLSFREHCVRCRNRVHSRSVILALTLYASVHHFFPQTSTTKPTQVYYKMARPSSLRSSWMTVFYFLFVLVGPLLLVGSVRAQEDTQTPLGDKGVTGPSEFPVVA